ncbi:hypothetical protein BHE74_00014120, partial [Ensete ventricosum]
MQVVKVTSQKQIELEESLDILKETASQVELQKQSSHPTQNSWVTHFNILSLLVYCRSSRAGSGTVDTFLEERQKIHFKIQII